MRNLILCFVFVGSCLFSSMGYSYPTSEDKLQAISEKSSGGFYLIVANPHFQSEGDDVTLQATATFVDPDSLVYIQGIQWEKDLIPLSGENGLKLNLLSVTTADNGSYTYTTNDPVSGIIRSKKYIVDVLPQGSVPAGSGVTLSVLAGALSLAGAMGIRRKS